MGSRSFKRCCDRLGGQAVRFFLRFMGKDTPVLTAAVISALIVQGVIDKEPTGKKALTQVQQALDE